MCHQSFSPVLIFQTPISPSSHATSEVLLVGSRFDPVDPRPGWKPPNHLVTVEAVQGDAVPGVLGDELVRGSQENGWTGVPVNRFGVGQLADGTGENNKKGG